MTLDKSQFYDILLTSILYAYDAIGGLNLGEEGGMKINSPGLPKCGIVDQEQVMIYTASEVLLKI